MKLVFSEIPEPEERWELPRCPVCDAECSIVYRQNRRKVVGCNVCVEPVDAVDVPECYAMEDDW